MKKWYSETKINRNAEMLKDHENRISKVENTIKDFETKLSERDSFSKVMCNVMLALLSHSINGNSINKLKEAKEELEDYLINKS